MLLVGAPAVMLVGVPCKNTVAQDIIMGACYMRWISNYTSLGTSVRVSVLDGSCNPVGAKLDLLLAHAPFDQCPQPTNYCT